MEAASLITPTKILRFKNKIDAFQTAHGLDPKSEREKIEGFVLLVGPESRVVEAGMDREKAIERAIKILEETDTVVFVSKLQSKIGQNFVTKDQLVFSRKQ